MKQLVCIILCAFLIIPNSIAVFQQENFVVRGTVISGSDKLGLPGVNILEKGTSNGTITDIEGHYTLTVSGPDVTIVFTYIGYKSQEINVNGQSTIDLVLEEEVEFLDEVVVVGYGVQRKIDLTGAISSIETEEFNSIPVTNVGSAIQGKAAGVQVIQNSGAPGSEASIKIRGTGTINNSEPLYVVDGFITPGIDFLNPDDIAEMQILKDAASSAIYGARAANGVIIITTKKGTAGKMKVNFNSYWGSSDFWKQPDVMDKYQYEDLYEASHGGLKLLNSARDSLLFNEYAAENWMNLISRQGFIQKYNLQVSGGNEKSKYLFSGNYSDEKGIILKADQKKASFRAGFETELTKNITFNFSTVYTNNRRQRVTEGGDNIFQYALGTEPHLPLQPESAFNWYGDELVSVEDALSWNPYTRMWYADLNGTTNQILTNVELKIQLGKSFVFRSRGGLEKQFRKDTDFRRRNDPAVYEYFDDIQFDDNTMSEVNANTSKWQFENILTFDKSVNDHNIGMVAALALEGYGYDYVFSGKALAPGWTEEFQSLGASYLSPATTSTQTSWTAVGIPFRFNYNFLHKYFFQFNFRADASSIFSEGNRWGYFPSLSLGWTLSQESFLDNVDWLTHLKIRANWGISGNNRIDEFASQTLISYYNTYSVYGRNTLYKPAWSAHGMGNPNILWEKTNAGNVGIDFGLFKYSLSGSFDVFLKHTSDMLLKLPMVLSSGMSGYEPWQNAGEVNNYGFEITMGWKRTFGKFSMDINGNFAKINNIVTKLGEEGNPVWGGYMNNANLDSYTTYTAVGQPIGMFYGWKIDRTKYENGIWREQDRETIPLQHVPSEYTVPGDYIFMDLNADNKIDENDKTYIGNPNPDFTYGLNLNFRYASLDLTIFFQGVQGNDIFNVQRYSFYGYHGDNNAVQGLIENSYTQENEDRPYPRLTNAIDYNQNYRVSDFYVEDGSYLRLKNLQLGYSFPRKVSEKLRVENIKIYIGGYNLITITGYTGFDPEIGIESNTFMGIDRGAFPQARTFMGGIILDL